MTEFLLAFAFLNNVWFFVYFFRWRRERGRADSLEYFLHCMANRHGQRVRIQRREDGWELYTTAKENDQ